MEIQLEESIERFDQGIWDRVLGDQPFSRAKFVRVLQESEMPGVKLWHLGVRHQRKWIAFTSFFRHPFDISLIAPPSVREAFGKLNKLTGDRLRSDVLFCGLPISLGRSHLSFAPSVSPKDRETAWNLIVDALRTVARDEEISLWGAKEFDRRGVGKVIQPMAHQAKALICPSLPTVTLSLPWNNFDQYLGALRSGYRRQVTSDFKRSERAGVRWEVVSASDADLGEVYQLYLNVFARAPQRLEQLSEAFLRNWAAAYGPHAKILQGWVDGRLVAHALLHQEGSSMSFLFTGMDYRLIERCGLYQSLLFQIVRVSLESGCRVLELGQTSYEMKQRLGGTLRPLRFLLRHENPAVHAALRAFKSVLFPEVVHVERNVFRKDSGVSSAIPKAIETVHSVPDGSLSERSKVDSAA